MGIFIFQLVAIILTSLAIMWLINSWINSFMDKLLMCAEDFLDELDARGIVQSKKCSDCGNDIKTCSCEQEE